jgi:hypothetical protein
VGYIASRISAGQRDRNDPGYVPAARLRRPVRLGTSLALSSLAWSCASCTYAILWIKTPVRRADAPARKLVFRRGGHIRQRNLLDATSPESAAAFREPLNDRRDGVAAESTS